MAQITLTQKAIFEVRRFIQDEKEKAGNGGKDFYLRIGVRGGGCSGLSYSVAIEEKPALPTVEESEKDEIFHFNGIEVRVDKKSMKFLDGLEVDHRRDIKGSVLVFNNPNTGPSCGCGESFAPKEK